MAYKTIEKQDRTRKNKLPHHDVAEAIGIIPNKDKPDSTKVKPDTGD